MSASDWFGDPACWSFADVLSVDGCSAKCAVNIHQLLEFDVLSYHHYFTQLPKSAKRQWMLDYFRTHSSMSETTYMIGGKTVCQKIWIGALGVPTSVFYRTRQLFLNGTIQVHRVPKQPLQRTFEALEWMRQYFNLVGDYMPHRMTINLPSFLSKVSIYQRMVSDFQNREKEQIISKSQFFLLWEKHYSHVTIPSVSYDCRQVCRNDYSLILLNRRIDSLNVIFALW